MGNAVTTFPFGIAFEKFSDLEKEHHENRFRELRLCPGEETDAQGTDGRHAHEEVFVKGITVD